MADKHEILAAVGKLVVESTWLEYLSARLVAKAGLTSNDMGLLRGRDDLFTQARAAAAALDDAELGERTLQWLTRSRQLLAQRDEVVHSIVISEHEPEWKAYHPKSGRMIQKPSRKIVELSKQVEEHVADGMTMSLFEWPPGAESEEPSPRDSD